MTDSKPTIMIVEDDVAITDGLMINLRLEGFVPLAVHDGDAALEAVTEVRPDLILLDISLPKRDGLDVLSTLREAGDATPIIVLSARQDEYDKVAALRLGADDYVTKPFGVAELLARIYSVLRRSPKTADDDVIAHESRILLFSNVAINIERREVTRAGEAVPLTHLEFELLRFLVENAARVFTRKELLAKVWGTDHSGSPRTVDNFIAQLRSKFEEDPNHPRHIVTVRGSGYRFDP